MHPRLLCLASCLLLTAATAHAQTRFRGGPLIGLMVTSAHITIPSYYLNTAESRYRTGVAAGAVASLEKGHVAFQPALQFCQAGYRIANNVGGSPAYSNTNSVQINYLKLPLNFAYLLRADGEGLRITGGGYASVLTGGTQQLTGPLISTNAPITANDSKPGYHLKAGDAGLQAGLGYLFQHMFVQASYSYGLVNVEKGAVTAYNRGFQASLSYLFGPAVSVSKQSFDN